MSWKTQKNQWKLLKRVKPNKEIDMKYIIKYSLIIFILFFQVSMTDYFGSNLLPQSKEELLCDLMSLILIVNVFIKTP